MGDEGIHPDLLAQQIAKAKAEAAKLEYELEELKERRAARDAEARSKTEQLKLENEERRLKNAEAARSAWKDVTPDLGSVERGTTSVSEDTVMFSTLLATRALEEAASEVSKKVTQKASGGMGVIVTTDADLVARFARYRQTLVQVREVKGLVERVVEPAQGHSIEAASVVGLAVAAANLLPGVLGMISANRSVTSKELAQDETTVAMAVTGAILGREPSLNVRMDRTRSLPTTSTLMTAWEALTTATYELRKRLAEEEAKGDDQQDADWLTDAKAVASLAQELVTGMTSVPQGATVSPLIAAVTEEFLTDGTARYLLVIRPAGSSANQLVSDRPLAMKDPVHLTATAAIAYTLIDLQSSRTVAAGIETGKSELVGSIGSQLRVTAT